MRNGNASSIRISAPASPRKRQSRARIALISYIFVAVIFLSLERLESGLPGAIRGMANDIVAPILSLVDQPVRAVQRSIERIAGVSDIYQENDELQRENRRLNQWREAAAQLGRENERLRALMKAPGQNVPAGASARVVAVGGGAFERSVVINVGRKGKIARGWPVVDDFGLVGRVMEIGSFSSRVLLITDLNSRIPVRVERSGQHAIAMGNNGDDLTLGFLPKTADIQPGDRLLTSGHGGIFPSDVPVGVIQSIDDAGVSVRPVAMMSRLDYLKVLAYEMVPPEAERQVEGTE